MEGKTTEEVAGTIKDDLRCVEMSWEKAKRQAMNKDE